MTGTRSGEVPGYHRASVGAPTKPHPHPGGCEGCREELICNVCGASVRTQYGLERRCTNGRCMDCHRAVCTPGGDTSPGHGFGNPADAARVCKEAAARRAGGRS